MALVALGVALLAGCTPPPPGGGAKPTPTFGQLQIPDPSGSNNWTSFTTNAPPPEVLPTRGRGVRILFYAPAGSAFAVSLRELDGTLTPLLESTPPVAGPTGGFFQILNVNPNPNPAIYDMYVRAPTSMMDPANWDILVVNRSLNTNMTDSMPMVVPLRARKVFTVTVMVVGDGHVTSSPGGITCGTGYSGGNLTPCSYEFGPGTVTLNPNSNDSNVTRFLGWSGNCPPMIQSCTLTLTGSGPSIATATFVARSSPLSASTCPTAPVLPGLRWVDIPGCAFGVLDQHPGITNPAVCDMSGYFCCEPGGPNDNNPRCGPSKIFSLPDCGHLAPRGLLRQPGGCYEVDSGP
jgi:hypothetical protein